MLDLINQAIEKPSRTILAVLCSVVLYLSIGQVGIKEAVAGIKSKQDSYTTTEQRVYDISQAITRVEAHLEFIVEDKTKTGETP